MRQTRISGTDFAVSVICLGTSHFGTDISSADSFRLMDQFVEFGGNFLDTANVYGDWVPDRKSPSEKTIGEWMKSKKNRSQMILATKGGHPDLKSMQVPRLGPSEIVHDLEQSLMHLQTDYIDLYWLHRDDPSRPVSELIEVLNQQVKLGKIRSFGCSNWTVERIQQANEYARAKNLQGFVANQMSWSLALPSGPPSDPTMVSMDEAGMQFHQKTGMAAVPYNSQASGFFSGRYRPEQLKEKTQENKKVWKFCTAENLARLVRVNEAAANLNCSGTQIALAYLLSQPFPVVPIIGSKTPQQLEDSCRAGDLVLNPQTVQDLVG